ncbi:protein kinase domain-containing protein [Sorangium sp. So ce887]|uniref:serine/threonine-protein kinase n=1 Tax=Sorangium sp. So ce887 TaxID=3133324 RepID=UPI003F625990
MTNHLVPGALVASRYRVDRQLAEGGMGVIWAATHLASGERVALKLLRPGATEDASIRRRLLREARAAAAVDHPNVPSIHDVLELDDGTPFLVMDLLEGESLRDKLVREAQVPLPELSRILLPVISAVGTAHALGIVHRDLKPDNIFLLAPDVAASQGAPGPDPRAAEEDCSAAPVPCVLDAESRSAAPVPCVPDDRHDDASARIRVLDFGIAKLTAAHGETGWTSGRTSTGEMLGTPYYMSPEQILGEHDVDHRADIWSLGVILYECLTSVRPTEAENMGKVLKRILTGTIRPIGEIAPGLPADVAAMIDRMLSPDRAQRPADLREVGALLARYAAAALRPFGPPAAPREPEGDAHAIEARISGPVSAGAADLDGEASTATLRAGSLLPAPPSSSPLSARRAGAVALEAPRGDAALFDRRPPAASGDAAALVDEGAAASPARERGAKSAGLKLLAAGVLLAAGAGLSLLRCSTSRSQEAPRLFLFAPAANAPSDTDAPPSNEVRKPTPDQPEMP